MAKVIAKVSVEFLYHCAAHADMPHCGFCSFVYHLYIVYLSVYFDIGLA